jgi:hypothetical protein
MKVTKHHTGSKELFMQEREAEQAAQQKKRRSMRPCPAKDEPDFETPEPWTGKQ